MVFSFIIIKLLYANAENVVKPPQIPTVRKILHSEFSKFPYSARAKTIPIIKLPATLAIKVPSGKVLVIPFST
jgi:hypothetical protein